MSVIQPPPASAFSTAGEEAIHRTIEIDRTELIGSQIQQQDIDNLFEIEDTTQIIQEAGYKRIALQFPDELLGVSVPIYTRLKQSLGEDCDAYVLADTTYGSCCVDEVAAAHVDADVVVHYGHACLSPTSRLPVIYVFGRQELDVNDCINHFVRVVQHHFDGPNPKSAVFIKTDVSYAYRAEAIGAKLRDKLAQVNVIAPLTPSQYVPPLASSAQIPYAPADPSQPSGPSSPPKIRHNPTPTPNSVDVQLTTYPAEDSIGLYIGGESLALTNFLLTHSQHEIYSYNPENQNVRHETGGVNKLLMRRYAIIQKARDADVFGILVGTLGVASYLPLMAHLRRILAKARKKCYTISVGKLNPAKLANFMEIECFVLVACPENSVIDSKEFYRPIVTPFELEIALGEDRSWTGRYVLNFDQILKEGELGNITLQDGSNSDKDDPDRPSFSLITGAYRQAKRYDDLQDDASVDSPGLAVTLRNQEGTISRISSAAGDFLQTRSFRGLEQRLGQDAPAVLEQGRSGIAKGYRDVDHSEAS